jgi:alpha-galactosidase/6-phospho-beta-glucosidase family protein
MTLKKVSLFIVSVLLLTCSAIAQQGSTSYNPKKYKKEPLWINMMNDPQANYFETIKAFREYYKHRVLPKEPFENEEMEVFEKEVGLITDKESEERREKKLEGKKLRKNEQDYSAEVRAFKGWMQSVKPWVRADGTIVSASEQQQILDKQNQELKEFELKNGKK